MLSFKFFLSLKFFKPVSFLFFFVSDYGNCFRQRKVKIKLVWKILNQGKIWTTTYILSVNNDIRGIKVDNEEIEVSLFADDPTGFSMDNLSKTNFLKLIEDHGTCSGLKVNHEKTEPLLQGNLACSVTRNRSAPALIFWVARENLGKASF